MESTVSKISFRIQAPYDNQVHQWSESLRIGPNHLARMALVQFLENSAPHDVREQVPTVGGDVTGFNHGHTPGWWQAGATPPSSADAPRLQGGLDLVEHAGRLAAAHLGDVILILQ